MSQRKVSTIKAFYVAVQPVGSKFAKALQAALREKVANKVLRVAPNRVRPGRSFFAVTAKPLDKIQQFKRFTDANVSCPNWTLDPAQVGGLGSKAVFARKLINSTNGNGIVEFEVGAEVPAAPLYTAYIPKKAEYRFHIFNGKVIDVQQKKKKSGAGGEFRVRNLHNGYVYCRDGVSPPAGAGELAVAAVAALGYQYGAVDMIYNEKQDKTYVLEVNSRPGLMGTTVQKYAEALIDTFNLERK